MANLHGTPLWYELVTSDVDGAEAFYREVIGWQVAPFAGAGAGEDYRILSAPDGQGIGGLMKRPDGAAIGPGWFAYIGVDDVDRATARIEALGGSIRMPPREIPGVGRFALVADPQGVAFYVMRGASADDARAFDAAAPGHCSWHELATTDQAAALDFYRRLFGWEKSGAMPMGDLGDYSFIDHAGQPIGAVMTAVPGAPARWSYYFRVPSIDAAIGRLATRGGTVVEGPHEVPGGDHIVVGIDPQGAAFALVGGA